MSILRREVIRATAKGEARGTIAFVFLVLLGMSAIGIAPDNGPSEAEQQQMERCAMITVTEPMRGMLIEHGWSVPPAGGIDKLRPPGCESAP